MNAELGPRQIDLLPEPVLPDQLIVGEAPLQMLADHVNVLEVALHQIPLVDRRHASGIINSVDDLNREANRVRGGEPQDRAPLLASRARRRRLGPELTDRLGQEGSSRIGGWLRSARPRPESLADRGASPAWPAVSWRPPVRRTQ